MYGALLALATTLTLLPGDALAQARHYSLESTAGLRLVNATAEPATLAGKKGLRVTLSKEAQARTSQLPQAQRATGEALVIIEGLEFVNGVIEAEIAGAPAPGAPESARGFVGIAFRVQNDMRTFEQFYLRPTNGRADDQERRNHTVQYSSHPDWPFFRTRKETPSKYEAYVDALPGVWTKVRIEVRGAHARLYVHDQEQPTLIVNDLKMGGDAKGAVALTPGPNSIVYFRNVTVTPTTTVSSADVHLPIQNAAGLRLVVAADHTSPVLRAILPGRPMSDRSIEILFPEHVTVRKQGQLSAQQLYMFRPGGRGDRPLWRRSESSLEYERDLGDGVRLLARATLEEDGVRFRYEVTNESRVSYDMIYLPTDPRLTSIFHDVRLERTYVHHADGFDLLASETPRRLTMPLDQWLPARYLASFTWPIPAQRIERRDDGILYYKSRAVDLPFIATVSTDKAWVIASFARTAGNVWSNPELTCQHVDPQTSLSPGQRATIELKMLVMRGSLDDALERAIRQRESLK